MLCLMLILFVLSFVASSFADAEQPPNIILILADDLGAKELSCYGSRQHKTPNLDRLASEGTRFETFYAMPLCTPTRVALMTGQYGFHNGFLGMQDPAFKPLPDSPQAAIGNHFTHADLLKSRGYKTAQAGKWQLSGKLPTLIHDAGFDEYRMWAYDHNLPEGIRHPSHEKPGGNTNRYWHPSLVENGKYLETKPEDYGPDMLNQFVLDFARRNKSHPFFIYYTSLLTHGPHLETPDPRNPGKRWPAGFHSNVEYLDHLMGQLLDGLKSEGLDQNTLVIFIGDNGTGGDGKGTLTELGARVPFIVRGPGVQKGIVSKAVGDLTDIMPTLADFSGAKLPEGVPFDGHSLGPVLRGEEPSHRDWIYSHLDDGRILRDARWLLEIDKAGKGERFFDCGDCRDGSTYRDVTQSTDPDVKTARDRFQTILSSMPEPKPRAEKQKSRNEKATSDSQNDAEAKKLERFQMRDRNGDGMIDREEFEATAVVKDPSAIQTRFRKMDADGNGQITQEEFLAAVQ